MATPEDSIRVLPGIGPKKEELFAKLNIHTIGDLLRFYPRDYEDRTRLVPIMDLEADTPACFVATVVSNPRTNRIPKAGGRQLEVSKVVVADHTGRLNLTFFNASYSVGKLFRGESYCFYGKLEGDYLGYAMTNPTFEPLSENGGTTRCILPVYHQTAGLSSKQIGLAVQAAMERCAVEETLPQEVMEEYGLCNLAVALREIHRPSSMEALAVAHRRLVFEEFFVFSMALSLVRQRRTIYQVPPLPTSNMETFYQALPFTLTNAQNRAISDILRDFASGKPMSRLVQGDVGCGKTMVAAAAAYCVGKNGKQIALMAPTEILAKQHFDNLNPLFSKLGMQCVLLTGSMTISQKKMVRQAVAQGEYDLIIGTHALLTEATLFHDLGLVIADEQHRFGVAQRAALLAKGDKPHLLIMSATPIPRTLALILYGDLDVSIIDELPPGRQQVQTFLVGESYRVRLNNFIRKQAQEGHQTFIVCPAIEEDEAESMKAAEQWAQTLKEVVFPSLRVALLHGKMKGSEKEAVMSDFAAHNYDLLVSTTVIEVGVDVPNATLMVVENADRFGLSQLHQLRGRIGRGQAQSYCILVSDTQAEATRTRLKALCATTDGFKIAEEDLKLRGPGDFFGSRQSGLPMFRVGDLAEDMTVLTQAQQAAADVIANNQIPVALQAAVDALLTDDGDTLN